MSFIDQTEVANLIVKAKGRCRTVVIGSSPQLLADALTARGVSLAEVVNLGNSWPVDGLGDWQTLSSILGDPALIYDTVVLSACSLAVRTDILSQVSDALHVRHADLFVQLSPSVVAVPPDWYQSIGLWTETLASRHYYRDLLCEHPWMGSRLLRFYHSPLPAVKVLAEYENHLQSVLQASRSFQSLAVQELAKGQAVDLHDYKQELDAWKARWAALEAGIAWPLVEWLQSLRTRFAPPGSSREKVIEAVFASQHSRRAITLDPVLPRSEADVPAASVDVIICVHNALEDVRLCLDSVLRRTETKYSLIIVDDGSSSETRDYLQEFVARHPAMLIRHEVAQGYTHAANAGLLASSADFCVLLNSDTVVTSGWLRRMLVCAASDDSIGLVGPLSNTASWQSVPEIVDGDDWASNALPDGMSIEEMGQWVAKVSARLYPTMPFLNGFCLMIRRALIERIGIFDVERFGRGYGEEDDYALRARKAGWKLTLADDAYVFHSQSRSYSHERRHQLSSEALVRLTEKHGRGAIERDVGECQHSRVLEGIRARARVLFERRRLVHSGREKYAGKSLLFVLPVAVPGGGANVVVSEALAMREMGVEVRIFNLTEYRRSFESAYPDLLVPVVFGSLDDLELWGARYDAVVATHNESVAWLGRISGGAEQTIRAYYVQGFEPYMYDVGSPGYQEALTSYSMFSDLRCFTKTAWTREIVLERTGVQCSLVGPSFEVDLFRPRPRQDRSWPDRPLRIAAMVRLGARYRSPEFTMSLLQRAVATYRRRVEVRLFGFTPDDSRLASLPHGFPWRTAGVIDSSRVARLLNEVDIFVDFSEHQAMGLTALEAMGCGAAVIVPSCGGATSFVRHEHDALIVDTASAEACWSALSRLISDHALRADLQSNAIRRAAWFFPERAALATLDVLFSSDEGTP